MIVQGVDGLRAVEETERICFGCAEERCKCKSCERREDEEEYEEEEEATRPRFGTYSLRSENEMVDIASRNETAASPEVMRIQREVAETEITGRRTEARVNFEEPGRGGPGYRSLDEESVDQRSETSRTDQESLAKRGEIDAYLKRIQWRSWALMGMEISWGIPSDNETARGTEQWKEMEENSRENDHTSRELMSVAVEKYNWLAAQEGIPNRIEEAEMEVTFRGHVRSLLEDMECSAMTWMQGSDGQWRVVENMVGRLWALEDAAKRLVAAVKKSAMMQLILKTMGVGIKSEIETAMRRWRTQTQMRHCELWVQKGKRARMRRLVQRYFLATYTYWVREERQRRDRPVWICGPDEEGSRAEEPILRELRAMEEALRKWMHYDDDHDDDYYLKTGKRAL